MSAAVRWVVRAPALPDAVIPARDQTEAEQLLARCRRVTAAHRAQLAWEYGVHDPAEPNSYRRIGP